MTRGNAIETALIELEQINKSLNFLISNAAPYALTRSLSSLDAKEKAHLRHFALMTQNELITLRVILKEKSKQNDSTA